MRHLSEMCIYTIAHGERLNRASAGESQVFAEGKAWVTGARLWKAARRNGQVVPVLFADAVDCSRLVCWGELSDLTVSEGGTTFKVRNVRRIKGKTPQDLVLVSSGRKIARNYIRPYAICKTPGFLS